MEEIRRIAMQILDLEAQTQAAIKEQRPTIIAEIKTQISVFDLTEKDLFGRKVPVKYRYGEQEWSGRGKRPLWFQGAIDAGIPIDHLLAK
jgi:DNA-binding protein H-NS